MLTAIQYLVIGGLGGLVLCAADWAAGRLLDREEP